MALCAELTSDSLSVIAQSFNCHHGTVMHARDRMREELGENPESRQSKIFKSLVNQLRK